MRSDYILLGLQEGATLEEAEQAYRYWKKKYQAADFDDEPEYAKRKIRALGKAYENICRDIAGYVPDNVLPSENKERPAAGHGKGIRKLRRSEDYSSSELSDEPVNHGAEQGISGFIRGLKDAGAKFLDELDSGDGIIPGKVEFRLSRDFEDDED